MNVKDISIQWISLKLDVQSDYHGQPYPFVQSLTPWHMASGLVDSGAVQQTKRASGCLSQLIFFFLHAGVTNFSNLMFLLSIYYCPFEWIFLQILMVQGLQGVQKNAMTKSEKYAHPQGLYIPMRKGTGSM